MSPILGIIASGNWAGANASSYESIATISVGSSTSSVSFTSIPQTYTHLQIRWIARGTWTLYTTTDAVFYRFNSDSGSNYTAHGVQGNGSSASAYGYTGTDEFFNYTAGAGAGSNVFGAGVTDILDYTNTNKYKTVRSFGGDDNNGSGIVSLGSSLWRNTAAITDIYLYMNQNIAQYSHFALYGIKS